MFDKDVFQGLPWQVHERAHERYRVVLQPPLITEIEGDLVIGKKNSRDVSPEEHVVSLLRKFGGRYTFCSPREALCARELRGERLRLDGLAPYTQSHVDSFMPDGTPFEIAVPGDDGRLLAPQEQWIRRVLNGQKARAPGPDYSTNFYPRQVLGEAAPLLLQIGKHESNSDLLARVRNVLRDPSNALALIGFTANAVTPPSKTTAARERLRADAQAAWRTAGQPDFTAYPFAMHCAEVVFLYFGGLRVPGKKRVRAHDRYDLEHVKMLPFVSCLAGEDGLVCELARLLMRPDQRLLSREQLRQEFAVSTP